MLEGLSERILKDDEAVLLSINPGLSLINVTWKKLLRIAEKRIYLDEILAVSKQHHLAYLLSDARALPFISVEEQHLVVETFITQKRQNA